MSAVAPVLEAFFTERLARQRNASPHTVAAYRDAFRLLLAFAQEQTGKAPSALDFSDLAAPFVACFLEHLEHARHTSVRTRNARLAAVRSFYRFAAFREPAHAELIRPDDVAGTAGPRPARHRCSDRRAGVRTHRAVQP